MGGTAVTVIDRMRTATFHVDDKQYTLAGVQVDCVVAGESAIIEDLLGTSIDLTEVRRAQTVSAALVIIAINLGSVCCARLHYCHRAAPAFCAGGSADAQWPVQVDVPEERRRLCLEALPDTVLHLIVCLAGSLAAVRSLSCTCVTLRGFFRLGDEAGGGLALPIHAVPGAHSCASNVVSWKASEGRLQKTARPGHPLVIFSERLAGHSALLEVDVLALGKAVGGIQLGVLAAERTAALPHLPSSKPSDSANSRCWLDGLGRVHTGAAVSTEQAWLHQAQGDRIREGDRIGVLFLAELESNRVRVAFLRGGQLLGEPSSLFYPSGACNVATSITGYFFFLRLDAVAGIEVQLVRSRCVPVCIKQVLRSKAPWRPLSANESKLLVRTIGPDSHCFGVSIDPEVATVGALRKACAEVFLVDSQHVELFKAEYGQANSGMLAYVQQVLEVDEMTLRQIGIRFHPNGSHTPDLIAHVPHTIS